MEHRVERFTEGHDGVPEKVLFNREPVKEDANRSNVASLWLPSFQMSPITLETQEITTSQS